MFSKDCENKMYEWFMKSSMTYDLDIYMKWGHRGHQCSHKKVTIVMPYFHNKVKVKI